MWNKAAYMFIHVILCSFSPPLTADSSLRHEPWLKRAEKHLHGLCPYPFDTGSGAPFQGPIRIGIASGDAMSLLDLLKFEPATSATSASQLNDESNSEGKFGIPGLSGEPSGLQEYAFRIRARAFREKQMDPAEVKKLIRLSVEKGHWHRGKPMYSNFAEGDNSEWTQDEWDNQSQSLAGFTEQIEEKHHEDDEAYGAVTEDWGPWANLNMSKSYETQEKILHEREDWYPFLQWMWKIVKQRLKRGRKVLIENPWTSAIWDTYSNYEALAVRRSHMTLKPTSTWNWSEEINANLVWLTMAMDFHIRNPEVSWQQVQKSNDVSMSFAMAWRWQSNTSSWTIAWASLQSHSWGIPGKPIFNNEVNEVSLDCSEVRDAFGNRHTILSAVDLGTLFHQCW